MASTRFEHSPLLPSAPSVPKIHDHNFACRLLKDLKVQDATVRSQTLPYDKSSRISISIRWRAKPPVPSLAPLIQQLGAGKDVNVLVNWWEIRVDIPLPLLGGGGLIDHPDADQQITSVIEYDDINQETLCKLLTEGLPQNLEALNVRGTRVEFPSVKSLGPPCLYPRLTTFKFNSYDLRQDLVRVAVDFEQHLLEFLRTCPKLERLRLVYGDKEKVNKFPTGEEAPELVELHSLRWFSHESPNEVMPMGIFNRLSLKETCNVLLEFKDPSEEPWDRNFPDIRDKSHLSGETTVEITCGDPSWNGLCCTRVKFSNSVHEFFIQVNTYTPYSGATGVEKILPFLRRCGHIKVLHLEGCMYGKPWRVTSAFKEVNAIVKSRRDDSVPLKTIRVASMNIAEWSKTYKKSLTELKEPIDVEKIEFEGRPPYTRFGGTSPFYQPSFDYFG